MADRKITVDQLINELQKYNHRELHVHHTWKPSHVNFTGSNHFSLQNNMRNFHVHNQGWSDIAQHVTLFPDGTFVTGRNFRSIPASIKGYNTGAFMVEMIGNFDVGHDKLQGKQEESIIKLAKYFDGRSKYIRFHNENASKSCPGTGVRKVDFMAKVRGKENVVVSNLLRVGDKGANVKDLQVKLISIGYPVGKWGADSSYGGGTKDAVIRFQKAYGLAQDGIAGPNTIAKINQVVASKKPISSPSVEVDKLKTHLRIAEDKLNKIRDILK